MTRRRFWALMLAPLVVTRPTWWTPSAKPGIVWTGDIVWAGDWNSVHQPSHVRDIAADIAEHMLNTAWQGRGDASDLLRTLRRQRVRREGMARAR